MKSAICVVRYEILTKLKAFISGSGCRGDAVAVMLSSSVAFLLTLQVFVTCARCSNAAAFIIDKTAEKLGYNFGVDVLTPKKCFPVHGSWQSTLLDTL